MERRSLGALVYYQIQFFKITMDNKNTNKDAQQNFEFDHLQYANNYRAAILKEFSPYLKGDIIEVGSGIGQFTQMLKTLPQIKRILAIEPLAYYAERFKKCLPDVEIIQGTIRAVNQNSQWNGIVSVNVLEHIEKDEDELVYYHSLLKSRRGNLCLFVPARKELYSLLDKDFGHYRRYTRKELIQKLNSAGFDILKIHYFNFIGYFAWLLIYRICKRRQFNPAFVRTFDRLILPVAHFAEYRLIRPPLGQSLIVISRAV